MKALASTPGQRKMPVQKEARAGRSYQHVQIAPTGDARSYSTEEHQVTFVPLSIKRRQHRKLLISPQESTAPAERNFDLPLIRTLGKAFYWQKLLDSGEVDTIAELAQKLNLEPGWVAEVLRMTRLSPELVQAIVEGRQPRHFNLQGVRGRSADVSVAWGVHHIN
jgi:hypothetical protein